VFSPFGGNDHVLVISGCHPVGVVDASGTVFPDDPQAAITNRVATRMATSGGQGITALSPD
jgi:hypothetical protein